ncbi:hypothetical protein BSR29_01420 [Boudabousia liubingyangii]|uniref:Microcystin degradation protein MlrC n=1 Tax=Boudabousia liubingyangii TaxID=1921764 RepID=A0A1Q5PQ20_9ACTO|nr:M81 family metallopeptidase [Boudabousia liubingyangii]OKL49644.1 hypothetical protein BSR29_01420 [Boudabousia liubingyangii]
MMRIVAGGFHIESSTFTPYISGTADFTVRRGADLAARYPWIADQRFGEDLEWVPIVHAGALPGGVVDRDFYDSWEAEFLTGIERELQSPGGVQGVLLDIHGAASVEGMMDAEGQLAVKLRDLVGPDVRISTSMDLHGNVSPDLFESCDLLTCYRTAPHIDSPETRERAAELLVQALRTDQPIYRARVAVPILLPGEKTSTVVEPGKSLYGMIKPLIADYDLWDAAIWMGFPWADQPRCHGVVVVSGQDQAGVRAAAEELGAAFWRAGTDFDFVGPTAPVEDAITEALNSPQAPFFISDTGDNPGAGGYGDSLALLRPLFAAWVAGPKRPSVLFASLFAPDLAPSLELGQEDVFELFQESDPSQPALPFPALVEKVWDDERAGRCAVLSAVTPVNAQLLESAQLGEVPPTFRVIVTEKRMQYAAEEDFARAGFAEFTDPMTDEPLGVVTVKIGYLEPDLAQASKGWVMALSEGAVNQDLVSLDFRELSHPLLPFDQFAGDPDLAAELLES